MDVGVEVVHPFAVPLDGVGERGDGLRVARVAAASVVGGRALHPVAVDVHVRERAVRALLVDYALAVEAVAAVGEVYGFSR